jgi:hypothetical protein
MENSQFFVIVAVAMVAGFILFRLYTVLGRRTGNERAPQERYGELGPKAGDTGDKLTALPDRARSDAGSGKPLDDVESALMDIKLADRNFDADHFLGAPRKPMS